MTRGSWLGLALVAFAGHAAAAQPAPDAAPDAPSPPAPDAPAPAPVPTPAPAPQPAAPAPAPEPAATLTDVHDGSTLAQYLGGAAVAFVAHESGHVAVNLLYGNVPAFEGITTFGFIPFVAIDPRIRCASNNVCYDHTGAIFGGGRAGKYNIVTAGFDVQHVTTEVLLTLDPHLRERRTPFRKGLFAFDILLSVGYALSSVSGTESPFGDAGTASATANLPRAAFAAVLLAPAALDTYRYFYPGSRWAPWASRAAKGTMLGISFAL